MRSNIEANLPPTNEGYGTHEYWEERYAKESDGRTFDWFLSPSYLIPFFEELTADIDAGKDARILMLGCGNSALGEVLYDAGWKNIVNIDYSKIVIEQMQERHVEKRPEMTWLEMDVMNLKFGENEFDLVIDKGTMDAMLTTKGDPWNPPEKDIKACTQEISEALRVLRKRKGSKFAYFTFGQPHFRKRYMQNRRNFALTHREIGPPEGFAYFLYVLAYNVET
ncbi:hypothetical protein CNAG_06520 [Cryptococcus neoformans var. grubii H99]|uniref:Methyltransferase domain-containing protein n=1 Tax=Cryptococcus neoformans (strain H99 / ATCC 208821 / CBS 10515 / FGSC 9487) TaxID=235443 RepID=J9W182_CRYN9|nr:hypothetical protein CNAG_06520 [Cryptococcus neoformans var. grubii H99]AFR98749.2 hypothetical protein CNAG_06520 [Cryptococcus neoformans var. grubii H99]AUB28935.1 hypothetical protein CKF44_06520 [Cryptococcus neoformans var. grubii]|eukprot:XP_012053363.1 hypothetical protein CNAG_06520 [Cryptococcus neoformans var. grubii H99]